MLVIALSLLLGQMEMGYYEKDNFQLYFEPQTKQLMQHLEPFFVKSQDSLQVLLRLDSIPNIQVFLCGTERCWSQVTGNRIPEWGVGVAFPEQSTIALQALGLASPMLPIEQVVTHELSHIYLHQYFGDMPVPLWFNEGFAMYMAGQWTWDRSNQLMMASVFRSLIPLYRIYGFFPYHSSQAYLAYAQSISLFSFIVERLDNNDISKLFSTARQQEDFQIALRELLGWDYAELEDEWRRYLSRKYLPLSLLSEDFFLWTVMALMVLFLWVKQYILKRRQLKEYADDDDVDYYWVEGKDNTDDEQN